MIPMTDEMLDAAGELGQRLYDAIHAFGQEHKPGDVVDSRIINEALARIWCAFCGQLPDETRQAVLLHFCQVAVQELPGDGFTRRPEPGEKAN